MSTHEYISKLQAHPPQKKTSEMCRIFWDPQQKTICDLRVHHLGLSTPNCNLKSTTFTSKENKEKNGNHFPKDQGQKNKKKPLSFTNC